MGTYQLPRTPYFGAALASDLEAMQMVVAALDSMPERREMAVELLRRLYERHVTPPAPR